MIVQHPQKMASLGFRQICNLSNKLLVAKNVTRTLTTRETGAVLGAPQKKGLLGFVGVAVTVSAGITVGSMISKDVASFLEENDLFVPSDDDDD